MRSVVALFVVSLAVAVACGGKVVTVGGGGSSGGSSSSSSSGGNGDCVTFQSCSNGQALQFCTTLQAGVCQSAYYRVGMSAFACPSCSDCATARMQAMAECGSTPPTKPPPPPPPPISDGGFPACMALSSVGGFTPVW